MIGPMKFDYFRANNLKELFDYVSKLDTVSYLAGGSDLIVKINNDVIKTDNVVDISRLEELKGIVDNGETITIGALETHDHVMNSALIKEFAPALAHASSEVGATQIRNMGTLGGNICNASPAADSVPALMIYDAELTLVNGNEERKVMLKDFLHLPSRPNIQPKELLKSITIKKIKPGEGSDFVKIGKRKAMAISVVNGAAFLQVSNDKITDVRLSLGSVAAKTVRMSAAEEYLLGKAPTAENFEKAGEIAKGEVTPITDVRSTQEYRSDSSAVVIKRALENAFVSLQN